MGNATKFYGVVEGFFSRPLKLWSVEERLGTIKFMSEYAECLNTYLYCPKDDPYVVGKWKSLYPKDKLDELRKTIGLCKSLGIEFVYGLNPTLSGGRELGAGILKKFNQLKGVGCRSFCLLFDDVPFAYDVLDNPESSEGKLVGNRIVEVANFIYNQIGQLDQFWLCTPDYCFVRPTPFTESLRQLNKNVSLMWTGNSIFAKGVSELDIRRVKRITSRNRLIWWSNYPVNDCEQNVGVFNLGGFVKLPVRVLNQLEGVVVNPMREPYSSLPFLVTFSKYIQSPKGYNRNEAWRGTFAKLGIEKVSSTLAKLSSANAVDAFPKFPVYTGLLRKLNIGYQEGKNEWGEKFLRAIALVVSRARIIQDIFGLVEEGKSVSLRMIRNSDVFPTNPNVDRYFAEIYKIVSCRLKLTQDYSSIKIPQEISSFKSYFSKEYVGRMKLLISQGDSRKALNYSKLLIELDRKSLIGFLNLRDVLVKDKLKMYVRRQNLNRFTCK